MYGCHSGFRDWISYTLNVEHFPKNTINISPPDRSKLCIILRAFLVVRQKSFINIKIV